MWKLTHFIRDNRKMAWCKQFGYLTKELPANLLNNVTPRASRRLKLAEDLYGEIYKKNPQNPNSILYKPIMMFKMAKALCMNVKHTGVIPANCLCAD